jgi:phosphoribosylformimino-5-aminoimidazole carboxamide ribotide isomerase
MKVIPAIDIINGNCVRLSQGDFSREIRYTESPLERAKYYESLGFRYLHLVDLDGARHGKIINWTTLEQIFKQTNLKVDFGGGVQTSDDIERLLDAGADRINIGSLAVEQPKLVAYWLEYFGEDKIILSADVRDEYVAIKGWIRDSEIKLETLIRTFLPAGLKQITCTDIGRDGMMRGPATGLYSGLVKNFPHLKVIASGGISCVSDLISLRDAGCAAAIVGKALLEEKILVSDLQQNNLLS